MNKSILFPVICLASFSVNAQLKTDLQKLAPDPTQLTDYFTRSNLYTLCSTKKVKTLSYMDTDNKSGDTSLTFITCFNNKGQLEKEIHSSFGLPNAYYSYSGDSIIKRTIGIYMGYAGDGAGSLVVEVEIENPAGDLLYWSRAKIMNWADSLKIPENGTTCVYENGLMKSAGASLYGYDSHRNVITVTREARIEKYRRVYHNDLLTEVYYTDGNKPEILFEILAYDANGMISNYATYNSKEVLSYSYEFKFDQAKRMISNGQEAFVYDAAGNLLSVGSIEADGTTKAGIKTYKYNAQGLPELFINNLNNQTTHFSYTYWE